MPTDFNLTISFGKSSSKYYKEALNIAGRFSTFQPISETHPINTLIVNPKELREHYNDIRNLIWWAGNWRSFEISVDNKMVFTSRVEETLGCYDRYCQAVLRELYCHQTCGEEWGCLQLDTIGKHIPEQEGIGDADKQIYWFQFGQLIQDDLWRIDKLDIIKSLTRESELKLLWLCPVFSLKKAISIVQGFPDQIDLTDSNEWIITYQEEIGLPPKEIGIKPKCWEEFRDGSFHVHYRPLDDN